MYTAVDLVNIHIYTNNVQVLYDDTRTEKP